MKARGCFALLLLVLLGTGMGQGQDQSHNGYWWVGFSSDFKLGFASGYAMAMVNAYDRTRSYLINHTKARWRL